MGVKTFSSDRESQSNITFFLFPVSCKNKNCSELLSLSMYYFVIFTRVVWIGS